MAFQKTSGSNPNNFKANPQMLSVFQGRPFTNLGNSKNLKRVADVLHGYLRVFPFTSILSSPWISGKMNSKFLLERKRKNGDKNARKKAAPGQSERNANFFSPLT